MADTHDLAAELAAFITTAADGFWRRHCPEDRLPAFVAGHRLFPGTRSALLRLLPLLHKLGVASLGGTTPRRLLELELSRIRGQDCKTWWSLFVAEALLAFGAPFETNPLIAECSAAQRDELRRACDTTSVIDRASGELINHPVNYWIVVARCEQARLELGLTDDRHVLELALASSRRFLSGNPLVYMDDNEDGRGRYDIYAGHGFDATCELPELADLRPGQAQAWEALTLATAREDGGGLAWGRSGGVCVVQDMLFKSARILEGGHARHAARLAGLAARSARSAMCDWWRDDAIAFHRDRRPHWYFGPGRLLEMSCNHLASLAKAALVLRTAPAVDIETRSDVLYPQQDTFIRFDQRGPGVWCVRQRDLKLQLPLVDGFTSDYVAAPVWPGRFEQVCDRGFPTGVPVVEIGGKRWLPLRRPQDVVHAPGRLSWCTPVWTHLVDWDWWKGGQDRPGERRVVAEIRDGWLSVQERWTFDQLPEAVGFWLGESLTPLEVVWDCPTPHRTSSIVVDGMHDWHSHDHRIRRLHQIELDPALTLELRYRVRPAPGR